MASFEEHTSSDRKIGDTLLSHWDVLAVVVYLVLVFAAGIFSLFRPNRNTVSGYFLAGRYMTWLPVGASLFASNIGSEHFIGLAGSGAAAGVAVGAFELNALLLLQLLGWVFLPVFIASKVTTLPEYMSKRFGGRRVRTWLTALSLLLYIFTKISVNLFSGAIFLQQALRWQNIYICIVILLMLTAVCTAVGGLAAVIYTDTLQFFVMIGGSTALSVIALNAVGGYRALQEAYLQAVPSHLVPNTTCGLPRPDSWVMLRSADQSTSDLPWPGFLLGQTPTSIWYWCADQMMVQRAMASKSLSHAKGATLFAGVFKLMPIFLIIIPGMVSRVLFTDEVACVDPDVCFEFCGSRVSCSNSAYPKLVLELLPGGLRGVMLAVMLSALISDLTSIFNSAATLFTIDVWKYFRPAATVKEQLLCARLFILLLLVVSVAWVPVIETIQGGEMYLYIQSVAAYLSPPIAAVYCIALFNPKINEPGAFWGLISGFVVGSSRMILDFYFGEPACYEQDFRPFLLRLHYMYFAMLLFWLTVGICFLVSILTPPTERWRLVRTTYWTRYDETVRHDEVRSAVPLALLAENGSSAVAVTEDTVKNYNEVAENCSLEKEGNHNGKGIEVEKRVADFKQGDVEASALLDQRNDAIIPTEKGKACETIEVPDTEYSMNGAFTKPGVSGPVKRLLARWLSGRSENCRQPCPHLHATGAATSEPSVLLRNLHQEPWETRLLNTLLGVMCVLCVSLYTVFSINPFTMEEVYDLQFQRLQELGYVNGTQANFF
ncbi:Sodium/solute symporter [Trinorchestia longiramus]|nr:Sodium/solute symporter [Trinorchestia longiramus]